MGNRNDPTGVLLCGVGVWGNGRIFVGAAVCRAGLTVGGGILPALLDGSVGVLVLPLVPGTPDPNQLLSEADLSLK